MLEVIEQREVLGKEFKMYGTIESPLFLAKDVAEWIEHSNVSMMMKSIDEDEKVISNVYTLGGYQECLFLTEYGLYEVLMQSRKPIAKEFKKKVKEILKALRLNQIQMINTTSDNEISNSINEIKTMFVIFTDFMKQQIKFNDTIMNMNTNYTNNENTNKILMGEDSIEIEVLNFQNNFISLQEFGRYLNDKNIIPKKIGTYGLYQLLRDNNLLDKDNNPLQLEYFKVIDRKPYLTKKGMVITYRLAKEQITEDYIVRKKH